MGGGRTGPTVIVAGAIANKCGNGGEAWVRLSWALGFRRLGCRVHLAEQIDAAACVDEAGRSSSLEDSANLAWFRRVTDGAGLAGSASLLLDDGATGHGPGLDDLTDLAAEADLLVNISGHLRLEPILRRVRRTAYVDIDPGFTQFWLTAGVDGGRMAHHDFYFTIGENIGTPGCAIPTGGIRWRRTRQPAVLDDWPVVAGELDRFTTVANWRGPFGPVEYKGRTYGLKVHEFRRFLELPRRVGPVFELALNIHPADEVDRRALLDHRWRLVDPREAAGDPGSFRRYVQGSGAEFSVAQGVYVDTRSGWFSDRTVRYLASGKPALVQDTGFGRRLPVGAGLLAFRTLDEAVDGAERIARDYAAHCRAAREVAESCFDSDLVLGRVLEETGVA